MIIFFEIINNSSIFMEIIQKIPFDIKKLIYDNYFLIDLKNHELKKILNHNNSKSLNCTDLLNFYNKYIKNDYLFISYLNKTNLIFKNTYTSHIIKNKKDFKLLNIEESLCTMWIYSLYLENYFSINERKMCISAFHTIHRLDAWKTIRNYGNNPQNDFMFPNNENIIWIKSCIASEFDDHSDNSLNYIMRKMYYISEYGLFCK